MNANALFAKRKGKTQAKKKGPSGQKPADAFFPKDVEPSAEDVNAAEGTGGSKAEAAVKKKRSGKGVEPPTKKQKAAGGAVEGAAPLIIIDDMPSTDGPLASATPKAPVNLPPEELPREILQLSLAPGASLMHGTAEPRAFLRGITSKMDREVFETYDDDALENRILRSSLTACIALGEQARRREEWRLHEAEQDKKMEGLIRKNSEAMKHAAQLEEALREAKAAAEKAKADGIAEGKAEAERVAAEAAKKAADEAKTAKEGDVAKAREEAVAEFLAEGWRAEGHKEWVASVVAASVDAWVEGPGVDWLTDMGDAYYQGGEFFTQHLIYRRLARHFGVSLDQFDPSAYGLPPLQPDVRVPLPPGEERPTIYDSVMMGGDGGGAVGGDAAGEEVSSKAAVEDVLGDNDVKVTEKICT
ncbi:unnamed protein product [Cuscuta europaea]|uniref:Uncharacterized protein n=1 Tax=Cuscuta europaea TaxID=41803 RepID=A0A9P0ZE67_CUSEU|nr:unnamed protein product [Cuscuta europaea]